MLLTRKQRVGPSQRGHLNLGREVIYQVPVLAAERKREERDGRKNFKRLKNFQIKFYEA